MADDDDWQDQEQAALRALASVEPPAALEDAVVARLRERGLLRSPRPAAARLRAVQALAAGALFALGLLAGRASQPPQPGPPRYALLLYGGEAIDAATEAARVAEYGAWARRLAQASQLGAAEKLGAPVSILGGEVASGGNGLKGFFLLTVASSTEAMAVARECPHLRHGGQVVVHPIDHE